MSDMDYTATPATETAPTVSTGVFRVPTKGKDMVFALLFLVVSILWADFAIFGGFDLGYTVAAGAMGLLTVVYPMTKHRLSLFGTFYATCSLAITSTFYMYTGHFSKFVLFFWAFFLMVLALINNTRLARRGWKQLGDAFKQIFAVPFRRVGNTFASLFYTESADAKKKTGGVLIGLACSLPGLVVVIPILCSSDAAFEALINNLFADGVGRVIFAVIVGVTLFGLAFASVFAATHGMVKVEGESASEKKEKGISATPIVAFLSMFVAVYSVYLLSQLAYFFNAFSGILPENFTVSEYARRGFFEMAVICAINIAIISFTLLMSKKDQKGNRPLTVRLLCLFICLFSLVIVSTVVGKLVLYMSEHGLTELRVYTSLFCICAAIVIICVVIRLFVRRFAYFRVAVAMLALISVLVAFADVNTTIARYNTESYLSGRLEEMDVYYLQNLDSAAVPQLVKLMNCEDQEVSRQAATALVWFADNVGTVTNEYDDVSGKFTGCYFKPYDQSDFREFNLADYKAQKLIAENWEKIVANSDYYNVYIGKPL